MTLGFRPISSGPVSGINDAQITQTQARTVRFASKSFVTRAADAPAYEYIAGRISQGLRLERQLTTAAEGQFGALIETDFGEILLSNNDGQLDHLVDRYAADGRQIRLLIGATEITTGGKEIVQPFNNFVRVYTSVGGPWTFEHDVVRLRIESLAARLHDRLQTSVYTGTGGSEGTDSMAGRTRPTAFGRCSNVPAQLVDPALLIYQVHSGAMELVEEVYDSGASGFVVAGDHLTYAALEGATLPLGSYATSLSTGYIRLANIPVGAVTADIRGHKDETSGNYVETTADIIRTILRDYGGLTNSLIDNVSFNAAAALQPADVGLFLPSGDQSSVVDVIGQLAFGIGAFVGQDRSGLFRIQRLDAPSMSTVHWAFTDRDIIGIERLSLPYGVPWKSWGVGYAVNWTLQADADLAGSVTQERRQFLEQDRRYAFVSDANIALFHANSRGAPLREAFFVNQADAEAEANRLIALYGYGRALYRIVVKNVLFSVEIGQTVHVTYARWNLTSGKLFVVVGIDDDADLVESTLTVFG
jgi:hypothetical protein